MLLQTEQSRRCSFNSLIADASESASSLEDRSTWNASLCALFVPIPGSFRNSSINRAIGSANRLELVVNESAT